MFELGRIAEKLCRIGLPLALLSGMPVAAVHFAGWVDSPFALFVLSLWGHLLAWLAFHADRTEQ